MSSLHRFASLVENALRKPKVSNRRKADRNRYLVEALDPIRFTDQGLMGYFYGSDLYGNWITQFWVTNAVYTGETGSWSGDVPDFTTRLTGQLLLPADGSALTLHLDTDGAATVLINGQEVLSASPTGPGGSAGDVNDDGQVDSVEFNIMNQLAIKGGTLVADIPALYGEYPFNEYGFNLNVGALDLNGDGIIDTTDEAALNVELFGTTSASADVTLTLSDSGDPGTFSHGSWVDFELDFGPYNGSTTASVSWSGDWTNDGSGGASSNGGAIPTANLRITPPSAADVQPVVGVEGVPVSISTGFSDSTGLGFSASVAWGDGTIGGAAQQHATLQSGTLGASHTFTGGSGVYSASLTLSGPLGNTTTPFTVAVVPAAPSDLSATPASPGEVDLAWTDHSAMESGFDVYISTDGGGSYEQYDSVGANVTSYQATGLSASTPYSFAVAAFNDAGPSDQSTPATATTPAVPVPSNPTATANATTATEIDLTWGQVSGATSYQLEWSADGGSTYESLASIDGPTTTYAAKGLAAGTQYTFRISAYTPDGVSDWAVTSEWKTQSPVPTGLTATSAASHQVQLTWNAAYGATGYSVERSTDNQQTWSTILANASAQTLSYTDAGLPTDKTLAYYRIRSIDQAGSSNVSAAVRAGFAPAGPTNFSATMGSDGTFHFQWADNATNEDYYVFGGSLEQLPKNSTSLDRVPTGLVGAGIVPGQAYTFTLYAANAAGLSAPATATVMAQSPAGSPGTVSASPGAYSNDYDKVYVSAHWGATSILPNPYNSITLERSVAGGSFTPIAAVPIGGNNTWAYTDAGRTENTLYSYRLRFTDTAGNTVYSGSSSVTTQTSDNQAGMWQYGWYTTDLAGGGDVERTDGWSPQPTQKSVVDHEPEGDFVGSWWDIGPISPGGTITLTIPSAPAHGYVSIVAHATVNDDGQIPPRKNAPGHLTVTNGTQGSSGADGAALSTYLLDSGGSVTLTFSYSGNEPWYLDSSPQVNLRSDFSIAPVGTPVATEAGQPAVFEVTRHGDATYDEAFVVQWSGSDARSMTLSGRQPGNSVFHMPAGQTSTMIALDVVPNDAWQDPQNVYFTIGAWPQISSATALVRDDNALKPAAPITSLSLTAYRTGGKYGQAVDAATLAAGDPSSYAILTNNNYDEDPTGQRRDYDDTHADVANDKDLAKVTLHRPSGVSSGTLSIVVSPSSAGVRLYKSDGTLLTNTSVDLASPSGDLAGLASGDVDLWIEGMSANANVSLSYIHTGTDGLEKGRQTIHFAVVDWTFAATNSAVTQAPAQMSADALSADAAGRPDPAFAAYGAFLPKLTGLPALAVQSLTVSAAGDPPGAGASSPFNTGTAIDQNGEFLAFADSGTVLTPESEALIKSVLGIDAIQSDHADFTLTLNPLGSSTPTDVFTRSVKANPSKVLIGADNASDEALNDDWVGAGGTEEIQNFALVKTNPNAAVTTTMRAITSTNGGTVTLINPSTGANSASSLSFTATADNNGIATIPFFIKGNHASGAVDDVVIQAVVSGQVIAAETLTVLDLRFFDESGGTSPIPLNPAVVTAAAPAQRGNLFGISGTNVIGGTQPSDLRVLEEGHAFTTIDLSKSKISPDKIEVLWASVIAGGSYTDSAIRSDLIEPAPADNDLPDGMKTGFRMRDHSTFAGVADGTKVTYYFGHPTAATAIGSLPRIDNNNYAAKIDAEVRTEKVYNLNVQLMKGPTLDSGITSAMIPALVKDVNTIWSQAGIRFNSVGGFSTPTSDSNLSIYYTGASLISGEQKKITSINNLGNAIDLYFVAKLYDNSAKTREINAGTVVTNPTKWVPEISAMPGIIVAGSGTFMSSDPATRTRRLTRTIAHELGHYLMNIGDDAHDLAPDSPQKRWNIMRAGERDEKRDISVSQLHALDQANISTTSPDVG